jgi:hypothetical protein
MRPQQIGRVPLMAKDLFFINMLPFEKFCAVQNKKALSM